MPKASTEPQKRVEESYFLATFIGFGRLFLPCSEPTSVMQRFRCAIYAHRGISKPGAGFISSGPIRLEPRTPVTFRLRS